MKIGKQDLMRDIAARAPSVLLLSQRRLDNLVAYSVAYEFEDTIAEVTGADLIDAQGGAWFDRSRRAYKLMRWAGASKSLARKLAPSPATTELRTDYDLFFPVFSHAHEIYALAALPNWRQRCRIAACYIVEAWPQMLPEYLLEILSDFDHIFVGSQNCASEIERIVGRPCSYLPLAADVIRFAPRCVAAARPIDVCNIGRRSSVTHHALVEMADRGEIFYYFDTVAASGIDMKQRTFRVDDPADHRKLLASLLQRSRYFFANRSRINQPEFDGTHELSSRFYEGAAAGAVMIGEAPDSPEFDKQFDWPDAVIRVAFNEPDMAGVLKVLDGDQIRLQRARQLNVANAALRHDWLHRLQVVFNQLGIEPTLAMRARETRLATIAQAASLPIDGVGVAALKAS